MKTVDQLIEWANHELYVTEDFAKVHRIITACRKVQARKQIQIDNVLEWLGKTKEKQA